MRMTGAALVFSKSHLSPNDRQAILEILRETESGFDSRFKESGARF
jgi:hypothetical protein